jgi:hypothetical protein
MALTTRYDREDLQHRVFDICIAIPVRHHSVTQEYFLAIEVLSLTSIVTDQPESEEAADGSLRSSDPYGRCSIRSNARGRQVSVNPSILWTLIAKDRKSTIKLHVFFGAFTRIRTLDRDPTT